ncbi:helix-turn-helix domain-containing protein (plasmid) [Rhizobium etli]|uniref:Helix-turn-helix domain-containing protein n=1 Tax=Rhizobium etli TaxID=29449 RepID=A0AAN1EN55_RHIET|nr:helix-turn-helix domain-containing protein [Rhizobium sp. NXC14]ARQ13393.1 helix-turn-helix domain-containing protein [Rhizobium etli]
MVPSTSLFRIKSFTALTSVGAMSGPSLKQWINELGLKQVDDPGIDKPVYRKPFDGRIALSAELEKLISISLREARDKRRLPRSKLAPLLGISEQVYGRYETRVSRLTVSRLIHVCEVLDATPEEIIAPAAPHLWGETETKAMLLLATIVKLRSFDEEILQDVFSLLSRIEEICGDGGDAAAKRASTRSSAVDGEQDPD